MKSHNDHLTLTSGPESNPAGAALGRAAATFHPYPVPLPGTDHRTPADLSAPHPRARVRRGSSSPPWLHQVIGIRTKPQLTTETGYINRLAPCPLIPVTPMRSPLLVLAVMGVSRGNPPETAGPRHWVYCVLLILKGRYLYMAKQYENLIAQLNRLPPAQPPGQLPDTGALLRSHAAVLPLLANRYGLERLANIAPKHLIAYILYLQESGKAPSTIKTDLAAIRFYHDIMSAPRYTLPDNGELCLQQRTILGVDRTWSVQEFEAMLRLASESRP